MLLTTSLSLLKANGVCKNGYKDLVNRLGPKYGMDSPISILSGLGHHSISDVLWTLRAVEPEQQELRDKLSRLIACDISELGLNTFEAECPDDNRPRNAIEVAREFANDLATVEELSAARDRVYDAFIFHARSSTSIFRSTPSAYAISYASYASFFASSYASYTAYVSYSACTHCAVTSIYDIKTQVEEIIRLHLSS